MGIPDFFFHLSSFLAPAIAVGLLVALAARLLPPRQAAGGSWWRQAAINAAAGAAVLTAGLWYWGVDGKIATYGALVLAVATTQWLCGRGWRRGKA